MNKNQDATDENNRFTIPKKAKLLEHIVFYVFSSDHTGRVLYCYESQF